ncbi:MAG TPA: hypothetical protein VF400_15100 [Anaeromyxobacteraceae bacterium]
MANDDQARVGSPVRPRIRSTALGLAEPAAAANVATIAQEVMGFTLTFYSVPADALEAPAVRDQIRAQREQHPGAVADVTLEMDPAAKVFLPITTVAGLLQLLSDNFRSWNENYAHELRAFLDAAEDRAASGEQRRGTQSPAGEPAAAARPGAPGGAPAPG